LSSQRTHATPAPHPFLDSTPGRLLVLGRALRQTAEEPDRPVYHRYADSALPPPALGWFEPSSFRGDRNKVTRGGSDGQIRVVMRHPETYWLIKPASYRYA